MKITLHPLFIATGIFSAVFGGLPVFVIYALTALLHECGHIFCAMKLGFTCERISLMPYGASAFCRTDGISHADEIKLALAGPVVNALLTVATAGLWWFFPETYTFTDTVFTANVVMFVINLLPAYPLDGGRAVNALIKLFATEKTARIALKISSGVVAVGVVLVFILAYTNFSLLIFALFLICSLFEKQPAMSRINFTAVKPRRGKEVKHVMLSPSSTFKDALRHIDSGKYLIFQFYQEGMLDEITEDEMYGMLQSHTIYDKIQESG